MVIKSNSKHILYRELQEHFNKLPVGFPATKTGSDMRLLQYFFDPNEIPVLLELNQY